MTDTCRHCQQPIEFDADIDDWLHENTLALECHHTTYAEPTPKEEK